MAWPDCQDLWRYWQSNPPPHVSLHFLAAIKGWAPPSSESTEVDAEAFDRLVNG